MYQKSYENENYNTNKEGVQFDFVLLRNFGEVNVCLSKHNVGLQKT